eukprot:SAG11_NODE_10085_length_857_cov_0.848285_1_plen_126_part_10
MMRTVPALLLAAWRAAATPPAPDLVVDFSASALQGPDARPATRACAGLLNGGPEFGAQFLKPLRMANYRGIACRSANAYNAMKAAGATNNATSVRTCRSARRPAPCPRGSGTRACAVARHERELGA